MEKKNPAFADERFIAFMKALSLSESELPHVMKAWGRGGGDKADLLHSGTVSIFRQLPFLLSSCRNIRGAWKEEEAQRLPRGGEGCGVVFGASCQILATFVASVSFITSDKVDSDGSLC